MTRRDPQTGLPIIGSETPEEALRREKAALGDEEHDWGVMVAYELSRSDAQRAAAGIASGVDPNPPIQLVSMRSTHGPVCLRCEQTFDVVQVAPCPGMTLEAYIGSLPEEDREAVLERLLGP